MITDIILIILCSILGCALLFVFMIVIAVAIDSKYGKMKKEDMPWIFRAGCGK